MLASKLSPGYHFNPTASEFSFLTNQLIISSKMRPVYTLVMLAAATLASTYQDCLNMVAQIPYCGVRSPSYNHSIPSYQSSIKGLLLVRCGIRRWLRPKRPRLSMFPIIFYPEFCLGLHYYKLWRRNRIGSVVFCSSCLLLRGWQHHHFGFAPSFTG